MVYDYKWYNIQTNIIDICSNETYCESNDTLNVWVIEPKIICNVVNVPRTKGLVETTTQPSTKYNMLRKNTKPVFIYQRVRVIIANNTTR